MKDLHKIRKEKGLSLKQMECDLKIPYQKISKILKGHYVPTEEEANKIAQDLGVDVALIKGN